MKPNYILNRLAALSLRQSVAPSEFEMIFLQSASSSKYFHQPIPNNSNIRLIPRFDSLAQALISQAADFTILNSCCNSLAKCSQIFFSANPAGFNNKGERILSSWKESISNGAYLATPGFFASFCEAYTSIIDLTSDSYHSFLSILDSLPFSLVGSWYLTFNILQDCLDEIIEAIAETHCFKSHLLSYLEFSKIDSSFSSGLLTVSICIDMNFSIIDMHDLFTLSLQSGIPFDLQIKSSFGDRYTFPFALERGARGVKRFLKSISMLKLYYLPANDFQFSKNSDILEFRKFLDSAMY